MGRPAVIRDETIVEAAREVFLARGFRATTAEVAERAGVSEGSIFKRFRSKVELFEAAMGGSEKDPEFLRDLVARVGQGDVRESLFALASDLEGYLRKIIPLKMMAWSNPGPDGAPCGLSGPNPVPVRILKGLSGYFEAEMRLGRLRRVDPEIAARAFMGAIHHFVVFDVLFNSQQELPLGAETYLRGWVQLAWSGLAPLEQPGPGRPPLRGSGRAAVNR